MSGRISFRLRKVIWAIDASEEMPLVHKRATDALRALINLHPDLVIQPVTVLGPDDPDISSDVGSRWVEEYLPPIKRDLEKTLEQSDLPGLKPLLFITEATSSTSEAVDLLIQFAVRQEADLIVANSHGRSGLKRLILGSFSEALLHRSKTPVMIVGPKFRNLYQQEKILFPTEFGDHSKLIFKQVVCFAKIATAELTCVHVVPPLSDSTVNFDIDRRTGEWESEPVLRDHQIDRQKKRALVWAEWAAHEGVKTTFEIDVRSETVSEGLLHLTREKQIGLIMMEARSTPLKEMILGSHTRDIIRAAPCPVWVFTTHWVEEVLRHAA